MKTLSLTLAILLFIFSAGTLAKEGDFSEENENINSLEFFSEIVADKVSDSFSTYREEPSNGWHKDKTLEISVPEKDNGTFVVHRVYRDSEGELTYLRCKPYDKRVRYGSAYYISDLCHNYIGTRLLIEADKEKLSKKIQEYKENNRSLVVNPKSKWFGFLHKGYEEKYTKLSAEEINEFKSILSEYQTARREQIQSMIDQDYHNKGYLIKLLIQKAADDAK